MRLRDAHESWFDDAACRGRSDLFFTFDPTKIAQAKAICAECPVRPECRAFALDTRQEYGVWGGMDETQRMRMLRRKRRPGPDKYCPDCGTTKPMEEFGENRPGVKRPVCRPCWNARKRRNEQRRRSA
jgi:WhiB family redox-sensing transcriptional regulator